MGISIQRRRGTTTQHASFTGKAGEMTVDTTKWVAVVHDGSTAGGFALAAANHTHPNATDSTPGFMSAADKTKLDSIPGGTINYQTVQSAGSAETQRPIINFTTNFAVTDDGPGTRTSIDLADSGVGSGTYTKVTVNAKGRVTNGTLLSSGDIPTLNSSQISNFNSTVQSNTLDSLAAPISDVNLSTHKIINLQDPASPQDAATKQYVDTMATGLTFKLPCRVASTTNVGLSSPGATIDTVSLNIGDRILLKDQSTATQNGIYVFQGPSTPLQRAQDADANVEVTSGMFVLITEGFANIDHGYVLSTPNPINLGTTNLTFVQFSSGGSVTAGNGINVTGNTVSVKSANVNRIAVGGGGVDLATIGGLTPGTYQKFTVDAYGRITATFSDTWQPSDTGLTNITTISNGLTNGLLARTSAGNWAARTLQPGTGITISNGDGASTNPGISVTPDTTKQQVSVALGGTEAGVRSQVNFIQGSGATLTVADNPGSNRVDVTIATGGGGGGAPSSSQYVTLATDAGLSNERVLVAGTGLTMVDGGSGNNVTLSLTTDLGTVP